jgi:hypothetical protein
MAWRFPVHAKFFRTIKERLTKKQVEINTRVEPKSFEAHMTESLKQLAWEVKYGNAGRSELESYVKDTFVHSKN